jgi:adenylate cyclase
MQEAHQTVMESWRAKGVDAAPIGIGIASGEMTAGEMGSARRSDYTVIGRPANLGARICSAAKAGQVLISQATYDMVIGEVEAAPISGLDLKGIGNDVTVYHVTRIAD